MENVNQQTPVQWLQTQIINNVLCDNRIVNEMEFWGKRRILALISVAMEMETQAPKDNRNINQKIFDLAIELESLGMTDEAEELHKLII